MRWRARGEIFANQLPEMSEEITLPQISARRWVGISGCMMWASISHQVHSCNGTLTREAVMTDATLLSYEGKLTRDQLALVPTPVGTQTHRPIPHIDVVQALIETLGFRHIGVVREEYAVSRDGMR